jgi:hypothetical protein
MVWSSYQCTRCQNYLTKGPKSPRQEQEV